MMGEQTITQTAPAARIIEELLARSAVYHGLSVLLRYPDADTERWWAVRAYRRLPELIELLTGEGVEGTLAAARQVVTELDGAPLPGWAREHERVFGHSVQGAAPPYELEYGEEHSHRQPQELGDIAAFYQAFGLRMSSVSHERVDHIVTECEFLQYLLYKQACALDEGEAERAGLCEAAARQFLSDHLGRWGPSFCLRLSRTTEQGLLSAIADLTLAWLLQDCGRLQVAAGPQDLPLRLPKERDEVGCAACAPQGPGAANGGH